MVSLYVKINALCVRSERGKRKSARGARQLARDPSEWDIHHHDRRIPSHVSWFLFLINRENALSF
jgi:hypothetical protein